MQKIEMRGMTCKECGGKHIVKHGHIIKKGGPVQRYVCWECGYNFTKDSVYKGDK